MKKELDKLQAAALINRADIARNEAYTAMLSAEETARMASDAYMQACEMRRIVREVIGELAEKNMSSQNNLQNHLYTLLRLARESERANFDANSCRTQKDVDAARELECKYEDALYEFILKLEDLESKCLSKSHGG